MINKLGRYRWPLLAVILLGIFIIGTLCNSHFWLTADQRGDMLMRERRYAEAARTYITPARMAAAQYRNGDFEAAARTYARVSGPGGAYNQATAWLMHGKYGDAITWYDRALALRPHWREAEENRAIAVARKAVLDASAQYRSDETADAYKPDEMTFDQKGSDVEKGTPTQLTTENYTEAQLRALWLRRVQTTPADFLRFKFAYQATTAKEGPTP